jgi:hypothetical protein
MTSRTKPSFDAKTAKPEPSAPDLCGQYRGIGIAAVAAAANAGKPKPAGPANS